MTKLNKNFKKLKSNYLFAEIANRTAKFEAEHPEQKVLRLGIGDTTRPLSKSVLKGLNYGVARLSGESTYIGYGDTQGEPRLRQALSDYYKELGISLDIKEIFINDGAKSDTAYVSCLFDQSSIICVQDPVYPVYVDSNILQGYGGVYRNGRYSKVVYLDCSEENGFFAKPPKSKVDLIYICSPNNPTGSVATKYQLTEYVNYALNNNSVIVFDAAYSNYIKDKKYPRSIYEIPNADRCSIEISSFSKWAGFTGVRLGWTVVPMNLNLKNTANGEINSMWSRRCSTVFNGASNIAQAGGVAVLSKSGRKECQKIIDYYMINARTISDGLKKSGYKVYGGINAPYIWMKIPGKETSWNFFDRLLSNTGVIGTPGSGFGLCGEGYFRFSAFSKKSDVIEAIERIDKI